MPLQNFTINQIAPSVGCTSGFPSAGGQHVTRNILGTFYCTEDAPANVVAAYPNSFTLWQDTGSGPTAVWNSGSINTNMTCLESFATGELYLIYADWINGYVYVVYWANINTSTTPTTTLQITSAGNNTKIGACVHEAFRQLFIVGDAGTVFRISDTATLLGRQTIFTSVTDSPNYVAPMIDSDGKLYIVMCNAESAEDYDYNSVIMCPMPGDIGSVTGNGSTANGIWFAGPFVTTAITPPLSIPVDPGFNGPLNYMNLGESFRQRSSLLLATAVRQGRIRAAMATWPMGNHAYDRDDLGHLNVETFVSRWQSPPYFFANASIHKAVRDPVSFARAASAGWAVRSPGDFLITHDTQNIIAYKSTDLGRTWVTYAKTAIPSIGTDTPHYLTIYRGAYGDTDIIGMFDVEHCTPTQWANSTAPVPPAWSAANPTTTAYRFSLPVL